MPLTIEMTQKSRELKAQGHDVISLSLGEPDFDTPDYIKEAAKKGIDENYTHYMPVAGFEDLRQGISAKFKRENNLDYSTNEIVVSTGAKQSLINVIMALVDPGDEVIVPAPYWVSYVEQIGLMDGIPVVLPTSLETQFKISPSQLKEAMNEKSRLMIFSSPNNPSGAMYSREELEALADIIATKKDFYVMYDEIYEYITYDKEHVSLASIDKIKDQVITINGLSKGFAMTGWRIGYMGAPAWLAKACDKIQSQYTSGTSSISQRAALAAVNSSFDDIKYMVDVFATRRELMFDRLSAIPGMKMEKPDGTFYMFVEVSELLGKQVDGEVINTSYDLSMYLLNKGLVSTVPGEAFGLPGYIRFSFAASTQVLEEACNRVAAAIEKLS